MLAHPVPSPSIATEAVVAPLAEARRAPRLSVQLAVSEAEVREAQRLRHAIFVEEMGARLHNTLPGHDDDAFDPHCRHLRVRETAGGRLIGCTRLLTDTAARAAGGFYSETEFELGPVRGLAGRIAEIGRTCVHREHRNGATIATLWAGIAGFVAEHEVRYLIGCASVPLAEDMAQRVFSELAAQHLTEDTLRVRPRQPLPRRDLDARGRAVLPPLLKAYLRVGARIAGEPCVDADFGCADLFILLDTVQLERRYARHFLDRPQ